MLNRIIINQKIAFVKRSEDNSAKNSTTPIMRLKFLVKMHTKYMILL